MRPFTTKIAVIILNYNGWRDTIACARSVFASAEPAWMAVIVDNGSTDDSLPRLKEWLAGDGVDYAGLRAADAGDVRHQAEVLPPPDSSFQGTRTLLIESPLNRGYAAGNNLGMAAALACGADACWVLNNDTEIGPQALSAMRERFNAPGKQVGLCGSLIVYADGKNTVQCCGGGRTNYWTALSTLAHGGSPLEEARRAPAEDIERAINFIYGASVMAGKDFLDKVGLMDERFFLYCEEQDWALRGEKQGFTLGYARDALVRHKEGASTGMNAGRRNIKRLLQLTRSRLLLTWKHHPPALPCVAASCVFAVFRLVGRAVLGKIRGNGNPRSPQV
jgi:GT2 family glycosyltransferase